MVLVDAGDGEPGRRMDRLIPIAEIEKEFKSHGHCLLVDTDGELITWGLPRTRGPLLRLLSGREAEMKRYLIARTLVAGYVQER